MAKDARPVHLLAPIELLDEITLPVPPLRAVSKGRPPRPLTVARPVFAGRPLDLLTSFSRVIDVPGRVLGEALGAWWSDRCFSDTEMVAVNDRMVLRRPREERTWRIAGSMRAGASRRWLPIELELWPLHDQWTRLTLQPRCRVRATRAYFATGNRSLDIFVSTLRTAWPA